MYDYVPEDANLAAKVNVESLWDKAFKDNDLSLRKIVAAAQFEINEERESDWGASDEVLNFLENFLKNPDVAGIDFSSPVVVSGVINVEENDEDAFISFLLNDSDAFLKIANSLYKQECENMSEYSSYEPDKFTLGDGAKGFTFPSERLGLAVDENAAVIVIPDHFGENGKNAKRLLTKLFSQENTCQKPGFDKFAAASDDVSAWVDYDEFTDELKKELRREFGFGASVAMGYLPDTQGMYSIAGLNFENGKAVLTAELSGNEEFVDMMTSYYKSASTVGFKYLPYNAAFAFNIATDNDAFVDFWNEQKNGEFGRYIKELEAQGLNEDLIAGLPGVICGALDGNSINSSMPQFTLFAEFDEDTYSLIKEILEDYGGLEQVSKDVYTEGHVYVVFNSDGILVMDAETFEMTGGKELRSNFNDSKLASSIANGGLAVNLAALPERELRSFAREMGLRNSQELLEYASTMSMSYDENSFEMVVEMDDENSTLLKKLATEIANTIENEYN